MTRMSDAVQRLRRDAWEQRMVILDVLFAHEVTCESYKTQEAGLYILGWDTGDFVVAALDNEPSLLRGLK